MTKTNKKFETVYHIAKNFSMLSNVYRALILIFLAEKKQATWTEIKKYIESNKEAVNPNTLHFHLKSLLEYDYVKLKQVGERNIYQLNQAPPELINSAIETIKTEIKKKSSKK
jgi:predicted transcriptional regulator